MFNEYPVQGPENEKNIAQKKGFKNTSGTTATHFRTQATSVRAGGGQEDRVKFQTVSSNKERGNFPSALSKKRRS